MDIDRDAQQLMFSDPRLEFSAGLRLLWMVVTSAFYLFAAVAVALALLSDIQWLFWTGILCTLVLGDRFLHMGRPAHLLEEVKAETIAGVNVAEYLAPKTVRILVKAMDRSAIAGGDVYIHLVKALAREQGIRGALWRLEVSPEEFEQKIDEEVDRQRSQPKMAHAAALERIGVLAKLAFLQAMANRAKVVEPADLFAAFASIDDAAIKRLLYLFSIDAADLEKALIFSRYRSKRAWLSAVPVSLGGFAGRHSVPHRVMNRAWTARPTPTLDRCSQDLTDLARDQQVGFLIGHVQEYASMVNVLARAAKRNVLLVGDPGIGKESIVAHLAFNIVNDHVPEALFDKRLVSLSIGDLIAGADPQEINARIATVAGEVAAAGNIILYIPDIHNLFRTSGEGSMNAADAFLPAFRNGVFQVIGSTFAKELKQEIEPHADFMNAFEPLRIEELSEDDAVTLLTYDSIILEKQYKVTVSFEAVKGAVSLAHKYFRTKPLPSSAEDLLKEALAEATQRGEQVLTDELVVSLAERKTNVPIHRTTKEEAEKLLNLEDIIHKNLVDQEQAVTAVARALREYRSGLARSGGPIATFLFVGPTGVGKTELAKILAKTQFGSDTMMLRFDMSEYQDKQSIFRFIGTPDGKMSGSLTEAVIQKPYSLILLDEFEKAHPDVLNIFLQVFDDGRITDNVGRVVDFQNTIIIATSNANSDLIKEALDQGRSMDEIKNDFKKKLTAHFRPELLNRFSDVIIFKNLSADDTLAIARLQLGKLTKALGDDQGIALDIDDAVIRHLAREGFDPVFGARPLRAVISDRIKSQLAEAILRGDVRKGSVVKVVLEGDDIRFTGM